MTEGSCLCGAVRYQAFGPYRWIAHCHCSTCRKHHGALSVTTVGVEPGKFRWLQGEDALVRYRSADSFERPFCRHCGSVLPDVTAEGAICPTGNFPEDLDVEPGLHIFVGPKVAVAETAERLRPFRRDLPGFATTARNLERHDAIQGSCLCGEVAFELDEPPSCLINCHCSRCRLSRSAAYGTSVFARIESLRWTRGAEKVKTHKIPGAHAYATSFCERCGSTLPAAFEKIDRYMVPVGALDTPLPLTPGVDVCTCSNASWLDITERVPQLEGVASRECAQELAF